MGPPSAPSAHSKNFVLCPGAAFDRSPCGTGTSAKLACLYADKALAAGELWRQESITGTVFEGRFDVDEDDPRRILPVITGTAHVTAEADPSRVGPVDTVIFAVKTYDNASALPLVRPLVGVSTSVLTLQIPPGQGKHFVT